MLRYPNHSTGWHGDTKSVVMLIDSAPILRFPAAFGFSHPGQNGLDNLFTEYQEGWFERPAAGRGSGVRKRFSQPDPSHGFSSGRRPLGAFRIRVQFGRIERG